MLSRAESLASATQVTPARAASHAPQTAEMFMSSGVIRSRRARVSFLSHAKKHPDVWWTTREEIAAWYLQNHRSHIA